MRAPAHLTSTLVDLRPHDQRHYVTSGRTVLVTRRDGFFEGEDDCGLFVRKTRLLSCWRWLLARWPPQEVATSNVEQHSWMGYYVADARGHPRKTRAGGDPAQHTVEVRLSRAVGEGLHEDVDVTNWTEHRVDLRLTLQLQADFIDQDEARSGRLQHGSLRSRWAGGELRFDYRARHEYRREGERGVARLDRGLVVRVERSQSPPRHTRGHLRFRLRLAPRQSWHGCLLCIPIVDGKALQPPRRCYSFPASSRLRATRLAEASFGDEVMRVLNRARSDLAALRLPDLGGALMAGVPRYAGFFGRDALIASEQASLLGPGLLRSALRIVRDTQGRRRDPWRDEQPGRMLHQLSPSPLAELNYTPFGRYYGSACTGALFCRDLATLWRWTADEARVRELLPAALAALDWTDRELDRDGDGLYEYQSESSRGLRNQGWKDSDDGIVHADGRQAKPPIATCEIQAFVYAAHRELARVLRDLGETHEAARLEKRADRIRRLFVHRLWMQPEQFVALGLDGCKRLIRSIASNAGHCMETGVLDRLRARQIGRRLLQDDLFSGWGVRTLSCRHPAYDPYSYHRGSVWPAEQGLFVAGLMRVGLVREAHRLARAVFEAASLYEFDRLPETIGGQPRDRVHPFPALYPRTNSPQAWSSATVFLIVQALLGIEPDAPRATLYVNPRLPPWLPEFPLHGLRVGGARVSLLFRAPSSCQIIARRGRLRVIQGAFGLRRPKGNGRR